MAPLTFRRLRIWNMAVGTVQLLAGAALLATTDTGERSRLPWYSFFVGSLSREDGKASIFYVPEPKNVVNFPIGVWSGIFLLLSAADHWVVALPGVNRIYNRLLCSNKNPFRWAEYTVSAGIMSVFIAQLSGVTDIHLLFAIFGLIASTMMFGWLMETANGERIPTFAFTEDSRTPPAELPSKDGAAYPAAFVTDSVHAPATFAAPARIDWTPFLMGCWPFLIAQLITACYFFQSLTNGDPPGFVWAIFFVLLALYCLFAVNQVLQFKRVRGWRGFAAAEWWYMILSLTSKQLLAWIAYGGTKRFENEA